MHTAALRGLNSPLSKLGIVHRRFRELLDSAVGTPEYVVVAIVDIRAFSAFSALVDSADTGLYIKMVYAKIIDEYFAGASFFKPTGDGLMITVPYSEDTLADTVRAVVDTSFALIEDFPSLVVGDPMITFEVPKAIGIGLARGSASCLRSGDEILDYSGRTLNLAARLVDLARPAGVVCERSFGNGLLGPDEQEKFAEETVYLPGIAETTPITIAYSHEFTEIGPHAKQPLREYEWRTQTLNRKLRDLEEGAARRIVRLEERPLDESQINVTAVHPRTTPSGRKAEGVEGLIKVPFEYTMDAGRPSVTLLLGALADLLREEGIKRNWAVRIDIRYPIGPT
jgi:class 3 adenylate cyclase